MWRRQWVVDCGGVVGLGWGGVVRELYARVKIKWGKMDITRKDDLQNSQELNQGTEPGW